MTSVGVARYFEVKGRCTGAGDQLEGIWDDTRREEARRAVLDTGLPYAGDTWNRLEPWLDEYAASWTTKHAEVCEATRVTQEQGEEEMGLRMGCLRGRKAALRAAVDVLIAADSTVVDHAVELASGLPGLQRCDDLEALRAVIPPPEDPDVIREVERLRERLIELKAEEKVSKYETAQRGIEPVVAQSEALGYRPLLAEAKALRGSLRDWNGQYPEAEQDLLEAYQLARVDRHDEVACASATALVYVVGERRARPAEGVVWGRVALACLGGEDVVSARVARLFNNIGIVLLNQAKLDEALRDHRRALAIYEKVLQPNHPNIANTLANIGVVLLEQGKQEEALAIDRRALAAYEAALGEHHPDVAALTNNIGNVLFAQGRWADALDYYHRALTIKAEGLGEEHPSLAMSLSNIGKVLERQGKLDEAMSNLQRALAIHEKALGQRHPEVARTLNHMGAVLQRQGRLDEAMASFRRSKAIFEEVSGPHHPGVADALGNIGIVLKEQGRLEDALDHFRRVLAIHERAFGPRHFVAAISLVNIGDALETLGDLEEAHAHFQRALVLFEEELGEQHPDVAYPLIGLANVALKQRDSDTARVYAERAVTNCRTTEAASDVRAEAQFVLARALWADGTQRVRARALAEAARRLFAAAGEEGLAEVDAWLAEHHAGG